MDWQHTLPRVCVGLQGDGLAVPGRDRCQTILDQGLARRE